MERPGYSALLIGEDPKQNELYAELIQEVGDCRVDVVSRAENSFDWVGRSNYHLIVIDMSSFVQDNANVVSGLRILERIKRISPVTSVILMSDQATVEEAVAAIRLGAEDYLKKPFNLEAFRLAVKRGLDRKAILGESSGASSYLNLLNSCQMISASLELPKIFSIVESYISRELMSNHAVIYSFSRPAAKAEGGAAAAAKEGDGPRLQRVEDLPTVANEDRAMAEIMDIALHAANPMPGMIAGGELFRFIERGQLTPAMFLFRFRCVGETEYFCVCLSPQRPALLEAFEGRLRMLKAQIEVTGKNIEQYLGVQHLVYVDDATGLYNTRYLSSILDREIQQSQATGRPFAVLFIDCDRFKSINDTNGHMVGTKLLNELGAELKSFVRDTDTCFRYGGDEFVAVLSGCDLKTAQVVAERIRKSVEKRSFLASEGLNIKFTVSIGVALYPDHAQSKKDVIEAADHAMYSAKRTTRNSVFIAELGGSADPARPDAAKPPAAAPKAAPATSAAKVTSLPARKGKSGG
jgi:diguanylate cyclase (GGDEF)-like protein